MVSGTGALRSLHVPCKLGSSGTSLQRSSGGKLQSLTESLLGLRCGGAGMGPDRGEPR